MTWLTRYPAAASLSSGIVKIYNNNTAFAAVDTNGQVITWGASATGGSWATRYPAAGYIVS